MSSRNLSATATSTATTPRPLTSDFCIRSLRRRLWKAFQDDDAETALRAYQASVDDFKQWLEEEAQAQKRLEEKEALKEGASNKNKRSSLMKKSKTMFKSTRPKKDKKTDGATTPNETSGDSSFHSIDIKYLVGPVLQCQMNPSEPFIADDFLSPYDDSSYDKPARKDLPDVEKHERQQQLEQERRRRKRRPRLAVVSIFRKASDEEDADFPDSADPDPGFREDPYMTTPLHEAARLGSGDFIRFLLANGGDPNVKNGQARTTLHMASGGFTTEEQRVMPTMKNSKETTPLGLSSPKIPPEVFALMLEEDSKSNGEQKGSKVVKAVGRIFQNALRSPEKDKTNKEPGSKKSRKSRRSDPAMVNRLTSERLDTVLGVLSWVSNTGDGPSINAVDTDGRTALHYAADLGRSEICMSILSNFGAMLTVVDDLGSRTPCELAAARGHADLAAQLEARALLYIDPYGLDDELMASVLTAELDDDEDGGSWRKTLVTPFNWFETLTPSQADEHRRQRLQTTRAKMLRAVQQIDSEDQKGTAANAAAKARNLAATLEQDIDLTRKPSKSKEKESPNEPEGSCPSKEGAKGDLSDGSNDNKKMSPVESENGDVVVGDKNKNGRAVERDFNIDSDGVDSDDKLSTEADDSNDDVPPLSGMAAVMASAERSGVERALVTADMDDTFVAPQPPKSHIISSKSGKKHDMEAMRAAFADLQLSHVEKFMAFHKWNTVLAAKAFRKGPVEAFTKAGVSLPQVAPQINGKTAERVCLICYDDDVDEESWIELKGCVHGFCSDCLKDYIKDCAASKTATASITCPHHECEAVFPRETIESLLEDEPDAMSRISDADLEQFVSTSTDFRFCVHPGCTCIVRRLPQAFLVRNGIDHDLLDYAGAVCTSTPACCNATSAGDSCLTYEGVEDPEYTNCHSKKEPKKAHRFCFACGEGMHWPVPCDQLEEWKKKMREEIDEVDDDGDSTNQNNANDLAQRMWIKANTRPCPQCNVPIEKNDGCNHMTCTNPSCRHEFCWICRKDWKLHGTATGGFFRCNIWQEEGETGPATDGEEGALAVPREAVAMADPTDLSMDQGYGTAIHSAREAWKQRQEMNRFLHHYTRWDAHGQSAKLEKAMADSVRTRLAPVVRAAIEFDGSPKFNFGGKGLSFVHSAFTELLECRSVLRHSYAFSFFRYPTFYKFRRLGQLSVRRREKMTFERLQSELEMMTEQMSDIVARSHLRASQVQIAFLTASTAEKREEFANLMFSILNEGRKEEKATAKAKMAEPMESPLKRRNRSNRHAATSPFGDLGRILSERAWGSDNDDEQGIRSTLDEFMSRALNHNDEGGGRLQHDPATNMWACAACTYMNDGGHRCAMCGSFR